jgi:hypothetical protein
MLGQKHYAVNNFVSILGLGFQRGASIGECPMFQNFSVMGQSNYCPFGKKKKKKKRKCD